MRLNIKKNGKLIVEDVKIAESMVERGIGLMFKKEMNGFSGLLIDPCKSIHTFFMKYPIDVIFLSNKWEIVKINRNMKPWRMSTFSFRTTKVLELKGGELSLDIKEGDVLEVQCIN